MTKLLDRAIEKQLEGLTPEQKTERIREALAARPKAAKDEAKQEV